MESTLLPQSILHQSSVNLVDVKYFFLTLVSTGSTLQKQKNTTFSSMLKTYLWILATSSVD